MFISIYKNEIANVIKTYKDKENFETTYNFIMQACKKFIENK